MKKKNNAKVRTLEKIKQAKQYSRDHYFMIIIYILTVLIVILALICQQNQISVEKKVFKQEVDEWSLGAISRVVIS